MDENINSWLAVFTLLPTRIFTIAAFIWLIDRIHSRHCNVIMKRDEYRNGK